VGIEIVSGFAYCNVNDWEFTLLYFFCGLWPLGSGPSGRVDLILKGSSMVAASRAANR
jgi:hypothetical protein